MSIAVTEFGKFHNDLCVIHEHFHMLKRLKLGMVIGSTTTHGHYEVTGSGVKAAAGLLECKNDGYAIDLTIAEMIKTMGDVALSVLANLQNIDEVLIAGFAVNYATREGKYVKMNVYFDKEFSDIVVSKDSIPFYVAY